MAQPQRMGEASGTFSRVRHLWNTRRIERTTRRPRRNGRVCLHRFGDNGIDAGEHSAIFYKPARFALLDNGDFWFSETPDKPSFGWDATSHKRICSWAKLKDLQSDKTFFVFCAHYDHRGQVARAESSKLILSKVNQLAGNYPAVVLGDLNALPDSEPIAILNNELKDAYLHTELPPYGPVGTANGFNWERDLTDR